MTTTWTNDVIIGFLVYFEMYKIDLNTPSPSTAWKKRSKNPPTMWISKITNQQRIDDVQNDKQQKNILTKEEKAKKKIQWIWKKYATTIIEKESGNEINISPWCIQRNKKNPQSL